MPIPKLMRPLVRVPVLLGLVVVAGAAWYFTHRDGTARVTYETAKVDRGVVERAVSSSGSVAASAPLAPARKAAAKWAGVPAPPDAMTGTSTAAIRAANWSMS
jgi:hypothetical protein